MRIIDVLVLLGSLALAILAVRAVIGKIASWNRFGKIDRMAIAAAKEAGIDITKILDHGEIYSYSQKNQRKKRYCRDVVITMDLVCGINNGGCRRVLYWIWEFKNTQEVLDAFLRVFGKKAHDDLLALCNRIPPEVYACKNHADFHQKIAELTDGSAALAEADGDFFKPDFDPYDEIMRYFAANQR